MADQAPKLDYTYSYHITKRMSNNDAFGVLSNEIRIRRAELLQAVRDPLGYGHQGRIAIDSEAERQIDFYDALVAFYIGRKVPVPTEARCAFLMVHGFYTKAELNTDPEFSKNYFEKLMLEDSKKHMEEFQRNVLQEVSSVLEHKDEVFKGDEEASGKLNDMWKKWEEQQDSLSLQEKNQMLCAMLAFLQAKL